jgi:hypothetical protein
LWFIKGVIFDGNDSSERLTRISALVAGLLIYLVGRAFDISIPDLMASSLEQAHPVIEALLGFVVPFITGSFVSWFCIQMMRSSSEIASRGLILFSTLMFTMFVDTYATLALKANPGDLKFALPNITFVLGIILIRIFTKP